MMMSYTIFSTESNLLHVELSRMNFFQFLVVQNSKSEAERYLTGSLHTQLEVRNIAAQISKSASDTLQEDGATELVVVKKVLTL